MNYRKNTSTSKSTKLPRRSMIERTTEVISKIELKTSRDLPVLYMEINAQLLADLFGNSKLKTFAIGFQN